MFSKIVTAGIVSTMFALGLAACAGASTPIPPVETLAPIITHVVATAALTTAPTRSPTATPTVIPTTFVTPPPTGQPAIIPILMYHHVADLPAGATELERTWTVSPKNLAAQVEMLVARGFHAVTMADVSAYLRKGKALPSRPIVISFDDGWETDYSVAFPILRRFGLVGTFYVYSNSIDRNQFLKWSEIDEMVHAGMEFGSHTLSHPHLKTLPTDAAKKEIVESKLALEKHLGRPITAFAYPFGEYNSQVTELVKNAGYETAVTIAAGYKQRSEEIYALHRTRVTYSDSLQDLTGRLP